MLFSSIFFPKIINTDNVYVIYCDFRFIVKNSDGRFNRKKWEKVLNFTTVVMVIDATNQA